jgi:hypothetical protein
MQLSPFTFASRAIQDPNSLFFALFFAPTSVVTRPPAALPAGELDRTVRFLIPAADSISG